MTDAPQASVDRSQVGRPSVAAPPRTEIAADHLAEEMSLLRRLVDGTGTQPEESRRITDLATRLVHATRARRGRHGGIDAFLGEYGLSSEEGTILMCLAEALLRIPDSDTADVLIAEKIGGGRWDQHFGNSDSFFVNASTFGLMLTGQVVRLGQTQGDSPRAILARLIARTGEPVIRQSVRQAMRILGDQFVLGRTIEAALERAQVFEREGYRYSYDMLGEGARTAADAERNHIRYARAIEAVGRAVGPVRSAAGPADADVLMKRPGLSVKLSAIDPRFEPGKESRLERELIPRLIELARLARRHGLGLTIDAEEQDRLDLTLNIFARCFLDPTLDGWPGFGLAVQAYGKRALPALTWLKRLAAVGGKRIPVRLVKGAYWDSEIKWAQERGLSDYPVFTDKVHTDVSYLAAMHLLLASPEAFYAQIATHNAHTVAAAVVTGEASQFEFQRLHGMGEALYEEVVGPKGIGRPCRIYAPVGGHEDLLAYLVRRLLENGANTSFVNRLADDAAPVADIVRDPVEVAEQRLDASTEAPFALALPRPLAIYRPLRTASAGLALTEAGVREPLLAEIRDVLARPIAAGPIIEGKARTDGHALQPVLCPHDNRQQIGTILEATAEEIDRALSCAVTALPDWDRLGGERRGDILDHAADLLERSRARLMAVIIREAGKTLENVQGDVREAVDFLRYYATEARRLFTGPRRLPGPTGERNTLELRARGPIVCISPWNFPLAIFVGQVAAALAAGNAAIAKPAEQTPITASLAIELLHSAGVPPAVLPLLPGGGEVGARLVADRRMKGIAFTGSNETAWRIQSALAARRGDIVPFIAETGGINAMIADSSALPEQVVRDAVRSAFDSAGQRCSAARVLCLQNEIADAVIEMLAGAVEVLDVGDPLDYATDIGPVIDRDAQTILEEHKSHMRREARSIVDLTLPEACRLGTYVTPAVFEMDRLDLLKREVFGPILHIVRFSGGGLDQLITALNATGYGLTLGLHSRIAAVADRVAERARVGNVYVNRNQIGAVVGVQPFGGEGLSGTGPKSGGPNYVVRFAAEHVRSTDTTVTGGNVELFALGSGTSN